MARTIQEIQDEIILTIQADPTLSGLTSVSAVALWRLITRVVAAAIETEEQLNDLFRLELEQIAREAVPGTADWLQKRVLEFQYDALNPQVVQVIDGKVTYPVLDTSLQIITRAAVKEQANGRALVKAAKDDGAGSLEPLTALEKSSLEGYLSRLGFVGIPIDTISQQADRVEVSGNVFYFKEYDPILVKASIITAIETYLLNISTVNFDGVVVRASLIDAIQAVEGVDTLNSQTLDVSIRDFSVTVANNLLINVQREAAAGYAIGEDTPGSTLDDLIILLPDDQNPNT